MFTKQLTGIQITAAKNMMVPTMFAFMNTANSLTVSLVTQLQNFSMTSWDTFLHTPYNLNWEEKKYILTLLEARP